MAMIAVHTDGRLNRFSNRPAIFLIVVGVAAALELP